MQRIEQHDCAKLKSAEPTRESFHRHRLRQIARLIDVAAAHDGDVVGEELERYDDLLLDASDDDYVEKRINDRASR